MIKNLLLSMRPAQWTKNLVIFAGLIFAKRIGDFSDVRRVVFAFLLFCLISSGLYILNDVIDREKDRLHPEKKKRPIASGRLAKRPAAMVAVVMVISGLLISLALGNSFGLTAMGYVLLTVFYSLFLKSLVIIDILAIAVGFVLRAIAGALAIAVNISPWLLVCTLLLALFLGLSKRRSELSVLGNKAQRHRESLADYRGPLLDTLLAIISSSVIISYALYSFTSGRHSTDMMYTLPFVLYGVMRYLFLLYARSMGGAPEKVLLRDVPTIVNIFLWLSVCVFILYWR